MTGTRDKLLPHVHSCRKLKFLKRFCCWLYLACVEGIKRGRGRQSADGSDEEVASSKKTELKTRVQNSITYLWPKRLKNHTLLGRTFDLYSLYKGVPPSSRQCFHGHFFLDISKSNLRTKTSIFFKGKF